MKSSDLLIKLRDFTGELCVSVCPKWGNSCTTMLDVNLGKWGYWTLGLSTISIWFVI